MCDAFQIMKLRHVTAGRLTIFLDRLIILGGTFALLGAGSVFAGAAGTWAFRLPMPWAIVTYLVYWPYEIAMVLLPKSLRSDIFDKHLGLFVFGLPMLGWGLIGIGLALWTAPRDTDGRLD
jgi:hypothetical protein